MDCVEFINDLNDDTSILIIGAGISTHQTSNIVSILPNIIAPYLYGHKKLYISDFNISDELERYFKNFGGKVQLVKNEYSFERFEELFPKKAQELLVKYKTKDNPWLKQYIGSLDLSMIKERFKKLDLFNFDPENFEKFDFIEARYVLHFQNFHPNIRIDILSNLLLLLNDNGKLVIQVYTILNKKRDDQNEYNFVSDDEIEDWKQNLKVDLKVNCGVDLQGDEYKIITFQKKFAFIWNLSYLCTYKTMKRHKKGKFCPIYKK